MSAPEGVGDDRPPADAPVEGDATPADAPPQKLEPQQEPGNPWVGDHRVEWLKEKACIALDMPYSTFDTVLSDEEGSNCFEAFLDGSASCLLLYPDEIVTMIETIVEPPPPAPPPPPPPEGEIEKPKDEEEKSSEPADGEKKNDKIDEKKGDKKGKKDDKKGDKKDDKKGKDKRDEKKGKKEEKKDDKKNDKKGKKGGKKEEAPKELEPSPADEDPEGEEEPTEPEAPVEVEPPKPQIIFVEKREPVLRASTGHLSEQALSVPVTYFLKMTTAGKGISPEQIETDVEFGVLPSGPSMSSLEQVGGTQSSCRFVQIFKASWRRSFNILWSSLWNLSLVRFSTWSVFPGQILSFSVSTVKWVSKWCLLNGFK